MKKYKTVKGKIAQALFVAKEQVKNFKTAMSSVYNEERATVLAGVTTEVTTNDFLRKVNQKIEQNPALKVAIGVGSIYAFKTALNALGMDFGIETAYANELTPDMIVTPDTTVDTMQVTPDTTVQTVDAMQATPDTTVQTIDTMQVTPDVTAYTADTTQVTPEVTAQTTDTMQVTPDVTAYTADTTQTAPEATAYTADINTMSEESATLSNDINNVSMDNTQNDVQEQTITEASNETSNTDTSATVEDKKYMDIESWIPGNVDENGDTVLDQNTEYMIFQTEDGKTIVWTAPSFSDGGYDLENQDKFLENLQNSVVADENFNFDKDNTTFILGTGELVVKEPITDASGNPVLYYPQVDANGNIVLDENGEIIYDNPNPVEGFDGIQKYDTTVIGTMEKTEDGSYKLHVNDNSSLVASGEHSDKEYEDPDAQEPVKPIEPDKPDTPDNPDNPEDTPDNPDDTPDNPEDTPDNPEDTPDNPEDTPEKKKDNQDAEQTYESTLPKTGDNDMKMAAAGLGAVAVGAAGVAGIAAKMNAKYGLIDSSNDKEALTNLRKLLIKNMSEDKAEAYMTKYAKVKQ